MGKVLESTLEIQLERQGRRLTNVTSWEIDAHFIVATDAFRFTLYDSDTSKVDDLECQPVELFVHGASQLTGRIDASELGNDGSAVQYEGRDYIADFTENSIDPRLIFKEGMTLGDVAKLVLEPHGVTEVVGSDAVMRNVRTGRLNKNEPNPDYTNVTIEDMKPDNGIGCYDFLNRLAARFHATIQPTTSRQKIQITGPNYKQSPLYRLERRKSGGRNNIVSAVRRRDFSSVPSFVAFSGTRAPSGTSGEPAYRAIQVPSTARALGLAVAPILAATMRESGFKRGDEYQYGKLYRSLVHKDDESRNTSQLEAAAFRALYDRLKSCFVYQVTVQGHKDPESGAIWTIDTTVEVHDEVCRVFGTFWIVSRTLKFDAQSGATTELMLWMPGLYQPAP